MLEELSAILRFPKLAHVYSADFGGLVPTVSWKCSSERSCSPRMGHHMGPSLGAVEQAYEEAVPLAGRLLIDFRLHSKSAKEKRR